MRNFICSILTIIVVACASKGFADDNDYVLTGGVGAYYNHQESTNVGIGAYIEAEKYWIFGSGDNEMNVGFKLNPGVRGVLYSYFNKGDIEYANTGVTLFSVIGLHGESDHLSVDLSLIPVGGKLEYSREMDFGAVGIDSVPFGSPLKIKFIINSKLSIPLELGFVRVGYARIKDQSEHYDASYIVVAPTEIGAEINLQKLKINGKFNFQSTIYFPEEDIDLDSITTFSWASLLELRIKNTPVGLFYRFESISLKKSRKVTEEEDHFETIYSRNSFNQLLGLSLTLD